MKHGGFCSKREQDEGNDDLLLIHFDVTSVSIIAHVKWKWSVASGTGQRSRWRWQRARKTLARSAQLWITITRLQPAHTHTHTQYKYTHAHFPPLGGSACNWSSPSTLWSAANTTDSVTEPPHTHTHTQSRPRRGARQIPKHKSRQSVLIASGHCYSLGWV